MERGIKMKKVLILALIMLLVGCKPNDDNNSIKEIPMRRFTMSSEFQELLETKQINQIQYIHGDVVVVYGTYVEDGKGIHVIRYDQEDGIILDVAYNSRIIMVREEENGALWIRSGLQNESKIDIYEEDGSIKVSAQSMYWFSNYENRDRTVIDIFKNSNDGLYYGITRSFVEPNQQYLSITQFDQSEKHNIYQIQVSSDISVTESPEAYLLTNGTFLLKYVPFDDSTIVRVQQITIEGEILIEEEFNLGVDIDLLEEGFIIHSDGLVKRYSNTGSLSWELGNFYDYKNVVDEVDDTIFISDGNSLLTIDTSGTVISSVQNPVQVGLYRSTLENGNDVYINHNNNIVTIKNQDTIVNTYTSTDLYSLWTFPTSLTIVSRIPNGFKISHLNEDLSLESEFEVFGDTSILQVFENGDSLLDRTDTLQYRKSDGSINWTWNERIYMASCYTAITDYIVIEYYEEEQDIYSFIDAERKIAILSLDGDLLSSYTFEGHTKYASYTNDSIVVFHIPKGETMQNSIVAYLSYTTEKIERHDVIFTHKYEYWYIDDNQLYLVRHSVFE